MRKSKFTAEQIAYALKQAEAGVPVTELCRKYGISQQTYYRWRKEYGGLRMDQAKRLKHLEGVRPPLAHVTLALSKPNVERVKGLEPPTFSLGS